MIISHPINYPTFATSTNQMQIPPSPRLKPIVKHYLFIDSNDNNSRFRLFSDGNPGIVFHFGDPLLQTGNADAQAQQPRSFIYGQLTHYADVALNGKLSMLVVVLQPFGLNALLGIAASELNNATFNLSDVFGRHATDLEEQILSAASLNEGIQLFEMFLAQKLESAYQTDPHLKQALNIIYQHRGVTSIAHLIKTLPVTERQLERKFNHYIGSSPKKFIDTVRFQFFLKSLQSNADKNLSDIIYSYGFYDQAHLNRCFKTNTGLTPVQYKLNYNPSVINFIKVQ